jgi:H+/Cl- antiporter ClcA
MTIFGIYLMIGLFFLVGGVLFAIFGNHLNSYESAWPSIEQQNSLIEDRVEFILIMSFLSLLGWPIMVTMFAFERAFTLIKKIVTARHAKKSKDATHD